MFAVQTLFKQSDPTLAFQQTVFSAQGVAQDQDFFGLNLSLVRLVRWTGLTRLRGSTVLVRVRLRSTGQLR